MNKDLIKQRFSKNLKTYNANAKIQKKMAQKLSDLIENKNHKKILEIGCGTGFLTQLINDKLKFELYKTIDIVEECQSYINTINPEIKFISDDIENYLNNSTEKFDLIISNATLQWINDFENIIKKLQQRLNHNGELIFTTFGTENFREIYHILGTRLNYYSQQELEKMFPDSFIEQEIHIMAFNSPKDVLKHLRLTGVNAIENIHWTKKDLTNFENGYSNLCARRVTLTYNPVYIRILCPLG